jgi:hypothetical protein
MELIGIVLVVTLVVLALLINGDEERAHHESDYSGPGPSMFEDHSSWKRSA